MEKGKGKFQHVSEHLERDEVSEPKNKDFQDSSRNP